MNTRHFLICLMLMLTAVTAFAAPRTFPSTALRGTLSAAVHPQIKIDGQIKTLSPGAKILSKQNTIIMSTSLMDNSLYRELHGRPARLCRQSMDFDRRGIGEKPVMSALPSDL